jgi:hypothetical protein
MSECNMRGQWKDEIPDVALLAHPGYACRGICRDDDSIDRRPCESRDPYAAAPVVKTPFDGFRAT